MQVVDPEVLGDYRTFDRTFIVRDHWGKPVRYINLKLLRKRMADVMYRKTTRRHRRSVPPARSRR